MLKYIMILAILFFSIINGMAQSNSTLNPRVRFTDGDFEGTYIRLDNEFTSEYSDLYKYYLPREEKAILIKSLKTSLEWVDLNLVHKKDFEKEISRLTVVDKRRDVETILSEPQLSGPPKACIKTEYHNSTPVRIVFYGQGDGNNMVYLKFDNRSSDTSLIGTLESKEKIQEFINQLERPSKSPASPEIDAIFKN